MPEIKRLIPNFHEKQLEIYQSPARFKIIMAGRKSGKTYYSRWDMVIDALTHPGNLEWYIAPTYNQAKSICWRKLFEIIPEETISRVHETELFIEFTNGSVIELKGSDNENSLRGRSPNKVILDETAFMRQRIWEEIIRPSLIDTQGTATLISTPRRKNWFWKLWQEASLGLDKTFAAFKFTIFDNPHLSQEELALAREQTKNSKIYVEEYMAEPQSYDVSVYPEFNRANHVVSPFPVPKGAKIFRSIDWGISAPCVCLWGFMTEDDDIYIYREHYQKNLPAPKQAEIIKAKSAGEEAEATVIDPSTTRRESKTNGQLSYFESIQSQFTRAGIPTVLGYKNVMAGISIIKDLFINNRLHIFETCGNLIMELVTYEWVNAAKEEDLIGRDKPQDGGDDGVDALRYLVCFIHRRSPFLENASKNCTLPEGNYLVTYKNGEIASIHPRKVPPNEKTGFSVDDYGGLD